MSDKVEFSITGVDELLGKLDSISDDVRYKGGRAALRRAASVLRDKVADNAKKSDRSFTPEDISKNIAARWSSRRFKRTGDLGFRVGVLGGAKQYKDTKVNQRKGRVGESYKVGGSKDNPGGDTWYWRFLEFGTSKAKARPFIRPAIDAAQAEIVIKFVEEYEKAIDRAIRRAKKKAAK